MSALSERARRVAVSTPFIAVLIALFTWPLRGIAPQPGLDPSWVAGLYMAGVRGMDAGTEVVFTYGPLGFLQFPNLYEVWPGRLAFLWTGLVHLALCGGFLWASRRAFGLPLAVLLTTFAAAVLYSNTLLVAATVLCVAALFGEWSSKNRLTFAVGLGALAGMQLLGSLRAGPTLIVMGGAVLLGLPDRRRTLPAFFGSLAAAFGLFWLITGQGLSNLDDYAINTAEIVGGYSASMVIFDPNETFWHALPSVLSLLAIGVLCVAAARGRERAKQLGLVLIVLAVTFLMFKHAIVRESPSRIGAMVGSLLGVGIALAPFARRAIAAIAVVVLVVCTYAANTDYLEGSFDFPQHAVDFKTQALEMAVPGRAQEKRQQGREGMELTYGLTPDELAILKSGTVHVAPWEAGAAWAYELDWAPLPTFQQYSAYTERLDRINAEKLESASAPDSILWQDTTILDPNLINAPGAIDNRWPAFESPDQMVQLFCRYRAASWNEKWAVLRRSPNRCGPERPLETVVAANGETIPQPRTAPNEALLVRVEGLEVAGIDRLRTFLFRAQNRHITFGISTWNIVGDTASGSLLLRVPRWADFPGEFALSAEAPAVTFERLDGFFTGVDDSTEFTLRFSALPLDAPGVLPGAVQKRRAQRSMR